MSFRKVAAISAVILGCTLLFTPLVQAVETKPPVSDGVDQPVPAPLPSPRLIVELETPPLAAVYRNQVQAASVNGRLDVTAPDAQTYIRQLQEEQAAFVSQMLAALPNARVSSFTNEFGAAEVNAYQIAFNGLAVYPGVADLDAAKVKLAKMPGVKAVYADRAHVTQLYTSTALINAPVAWTALGGIGNAGAGVKVASLDGGVHHLSPMMSGEGYAYPNGFGPNGKGLISNNNGKIITSRVYFRSWDPPALGDENPWPGENGTSHGMHTASTAAGNVVTDVVYGGFTVGPMSGVAPSAYVMSYRVFYASVNGLESMYDAEGLAALEDIVADGADVVNNSWGGGAYSTGGEFDPIDQALVNTWNAGVFVSMSAGNAGPNLATGDHPSPEYINVAASTTGGTLASGRVSAVSNDPNLQDFPMAFSSFGESPAIGQTFVYTYVPSGIADSGNVEGCNAWAPGTFTGQAALIRRGTCEFGVKVLNAEQAGAVFVVVYNSVAGGEGLINMGPGAVGDQATIPSVFIGNTDDNKLVTFYDDNPGTAQVELDTIAFQSGNTADRIVNFSSRGPAVGNVLKPDIAAPGVNILAGGFTPLVSGEAVHLGYGQTSGTSMAAPHVSGAAALVKQAHPAWPNWAVKSALMSTSKYMEIYNFDESPAQPLDMGAGRLDLTRALNPGVVLDPPSLSFGGIPTGTVATIVVQVTSVATGTETYALSSLYTGDGFAPTQTTTLPGITLDPASLTLNPGETKSISVTFSTAAGQGLGDNQGYIVMDGALHDAHLPAWARVGHATQLAQVLIIDNDFSDLVQPYDYLWYYTDALDTLGITYEVVNVDDNFAQVETLPDSTTLAAFDAILWFTGDNYEADGTYSISTGLTQVDLDRLVEYLNNGGKLIAMGQDLASAVGAAEFNPTTFVDLYNGHLDANYVQDSVSGFATPDSFIVPTSSAPGLLSDVVVDLTRARKGEAEGFLLGADEVPANASETSGEFALRYDLSQNLLEIQFSVTPTPTVPITITGAHIHDGAMGVNGPVVRSLLPVSFVPTVVTETVFFDAIITDLTPAEVSTMLSDGFYINVHTTDFPAGEIRGQILMVPLDNQIYVDEVTDRFFDNSEDPNGTDPSKVIFTYQGPFNLLGGGVAVANRAQPSLENPGIAYLGRSIYTSFGLEGMNESLNPTLGVTPTTRSELVELFLTWAESEAGTATITNTTPVSATGTLLAVEFAAPVLAAGALAPAAAVEAVEYRWDFGDGSPFVVSVSADAGHMYACSDTNLYTVRVEVTDSAGNVAIGSHELDVTNSCFSEPETIKNIFMPAVSN